MSETDRVSQIRLAVDQEVFIETVERDHTVEDANVATEVTSFERVGDAYVLEGAIVFAGYLTKTDGQGGGYGTMSPSAKPVHHRMPFTLRVPVQFQPRGVVNVASRISDWQLDVISEGWVRVQAKLRVSGLNGKHGYHFQCGAQEEGDVLFGNSTSEAPEDSDAPSDTVAENTEGHGTASSADSGKQPAEVNLELVRGQANRSSQEPADSPEDEATKLSQARGGAGESEEPSNPGAGLQEPSAREAAPNHVEQSSSAREELLSLDRHVQAGEAQTGSVKEAGESRQPAAKANEASPDAQAPRREASEDTADSSETSEFEFEHQVDLKKAEMQSDSENVRTESEDAVRKGAQTEQESFVASRSFSEDGFQATAGFVPTVRVGSQASEIAEESLDEESSDDEERGIVTVDTSLWSFVDFNGPEHFYTLRYVIVMEEESIATVAERVGCSETELMRSNSVSSDSVVPGQVLKVPSSFAPVPH